MDRCWCRTPPGAPALVEQRGYQSLPQPEDLIDRGFSKAQARTAPALGIPLWDVHGQQHGWQIRPDAAPADEGWQGF